MSIIMRNGKKYGGTASSMAKDIIYDGTESELNSENVQDVVDELSSKIDECFQSVSNGKALIASAITDKKVETDATATFEEMVANIRSIKGGSGNATVADVLSGKTFTNSDGVEYTGKMTNNGAKTASLNCGDSYTISAGYHNGSGKVTTNSLASQTSATATAANISKGKTAWVNGKKITGSGPTNFRSGSLESNYAVSGLTVGRTYIISTAGLENSMIPSIKSGGTELKKVSAFSIDDYSGLKTMIASIMFTATAKSVVLTNVTLYGRNGWTLVEI